MKNLNIRTKLLFGFAMISILSVIIGLVGIFGLTSTNKKYHGMISKNTSEIISINNILENYMSQRLILRGVVTSINDPVKLQNDIDSLKVYENDMINLMSVYESNFTYNDYDKNYSSAKDAYVNLYKAAKSKFIDAAVSGDYDLLLAEMEQGGNESLPITEGLKATINNINEKIEADSAAMSKNAIIITIIQIAVIVASTVIAIILGIYISSLISKPIKIMSNFFVKFATTGALSLSAEDQKNIAESGKIKDEIGQCISAAAGMVSRLIVINDKLEKISGGDLTVDIQLLSDEDSLGISVDKMVESLNKMFNGLRISSGQVSIGAEQIAQGAQELATGSSQQASSIEEFSHLLSELQGKTELNAEISTKAQYVNNQAGTMLEESILSMKEMLEAMNKIGESSKNITKVIKVIDDIAFQTNILALNAAVEAARAGQHGKGFAVVADEVRNLAIKSAAAAKETAILIEGSTEKVREGNDIMDKTNANLDAVAKGSKEVITLISKVSSFSSEQARAIKDMNQNIEQISNVVQENSASAEESAAAAEQMSSQANMMNELVGKFKVKPLENSSAPERENQQSKFNLAPKTNSKY